MSVIDIAGSPLATERYDARPGTVYLIRPDRYVAARWRTADAGKVQKALARARGV